MGPAQLWLGSTSGSDAGLRFDLAAKVYLNDTLVGSGELDSVPGGTSSFQNATRDVVPLTLVAPVPVSSGQILSILVMVRNACSGSTQNSGAARLWYNGLSLDSGPGRDAGSRFDASIGGSGLSYFLRNGLVLTTTGGSSRTYVDTAVGAPCGTFLPLGDWATTLP